MRSAEDTGIFKIEEYFVYFLFLIYLVFFSMNFIQWLSHKKCRMIGHCNKTTWNTGLKLQKAPLLYICISHAEQQALLKNGNILLCTSTQSAPPKKMYSWWKVLRLRSIFNVNIISRTIQHWKALTYLT